MAASAFFGSSLSMNAIDLANRADAAPVPAPADVRPPDPLLVAPILPTLVRLALPTMAAMLVGSLASVVETAYVGRLGVAALAGIAVVFPMIMLQGMLSGGAMGGGVTAAVSRALGAGDSDRADALAVHAFWIAIIAGVTTTLLLEIGGPWLFAALGGRGAALAEAMAFGRVAFLGATGIWLINLLAAVLRASGNVRVPSLTQFWTAILQVAIGGGLGLFAGFGMAGVAAGQVVASTVGATVLLRYLVSGKGRVRLSLATTPLSRDMFAAILKVGGPACISPLQTIATVVILTRVVSGFGSQALAGYGIGSRLEFLMIPLGFAIGVASMPLIGTAIGAGDVARARRAAWLAAVLAAGMLGSIGMVLAFGPHLWTALFTADPATQDAASLYFRWAGPCYWLFGLGLCLYFSSLAAGRVQGVILAGTARLLVVAVGGWWLVSIAAPVWTLFALIGAAMAAYGVATLVAVRWSNWGAVD